ncbi:MAG: tetratricopeptide repeat protein [Pirellulales bacterium]|nr:tetratricopeptide repeat protein [Pirellulales bacterium]
MSRLRPGKMQAAFAQDNAVEHTWLPGAARWPLLVLVVFLLLVVGRWEIIDSPPYYDFALGLFTEANFLVDSDFDYYRLAHAEATGNDGGPRVYLISVLPTLLALVMKAAPSTRSVLVVSHLASLACGSVLLVTLFRMLAPLAGGAAAAAAVAILASTPMFSTQLDMLGIDLPMTTAAVLAMLLASHRRLVLASLAATAAFAMKPSGLIATAALVAYDACLIVVLLQQAGWRARVVWSTCAATAWTCGLLVAQLLVYQWSNLNERLQELAVGKGFVSAVLALCPDQVLMFLFAVGATAVSCGASVWQRLRRSDGGRPVASSLATQRGLLLIAAWLVVVATIGAIVFYVGVYSVRYLLLGLPFLYAILALTVLRWMDARALATLALGAVAFNLANWNGYFFPAVNEYRRHCSVLERSHEYLADHRSNIDAMRELEAKYPKDAIVAGFPFPYYLSYPRLGYVARPLHGYSINPFAGSAFLQAARLFDDLPAQLTFIRVDNPNYESGAVRVPPPTDGDSVLYDDRQASPLVVYRRKLPTTNGDSQARTNWLLNELWLGSPRDASDLARLLLRARWLGAYRPALAIELVRRSGVKDKLAARLLVGDLLLAVGQPREAVDVLAAAAQEAPADAQIHLRMGDAWQALGDLRQARRAFEQAATLDPSSAAPLSRLGMLSLQARDFGEAVDRFRQALALDPLEPTTHNALGVALAHRGDWQSARLEFARACELDPTLREAQQNLTKADQMLRGAAPASGS